MRVNKGEKKREYGGESKTEKNPISFFGFKQNNCNNNGKSYRVVMKDCSPAFKSLFWFVSLLLVVFKLMLLPMLLVK